VAEVLDVEAVLRRVLVWLIERQVRLLDVQRTNIETYCRWLEEQGGARATVGRRLSTLARFLAATCSARQPRNGVPPPTASEPTQSR
jgi:site-specific recombinase XerD